MKWKATAIALAALMAAGAAGAVPAAKRPQLVSVSYDIFENRHWPDDDREIITQISFSGDDYTVFRHFERVNGATTPIVRALNFDNDYVVEPTRAQYEALAKALIEAGLFSLKSDPDAAQGDYTADLDMDIGGREARFSFNTPPTEGARLAVHKVLLDFAHQLDIDRPRKADAEDISEGDTAPVRTVELTELIAHPETYDGKRVRVTGYYQGEFEGMTFCIDKTAVKTNRYDKCIWREETSTFANPTDIDSGNSRWETIEGVFFKGPAGHFSMWPGEITRLTRVHPLVPTVRTPAK